jgi:hypothetical protein
MNYILFFTYRVDIADESKKVLLNGFIESVKVLELLADGPREAQVNFLSNEHHS